MDAASFYVCQAFGKLGINDLAPLERVLVVRTEVFDIDGHSESYRSKRNELSSSR